MKTIEGKDYFSVTQNSGNGYGEVDEQVAPIRLLLTRTQGDKLLSDPLQLLLTTFGYFDSESR